MARGRTTRTGTTSGRSRSNKISKSTDPCRKWVQVLRPPAKGIGFKVKTWVPYNRITPQEREELLGKTDTEVSGSHTSSDIPNTDSTSSASAGYSNQFATAAVTTPQKTSDPLPISTPGTMDMFGLFFTEELNSAEDGPNLEGNDSEVAKPPPST